MRFLQKFFTFCALWLATPGFAENHAPAPLIFSPVPQQSALQTATNWEPLVAALSQISGLEIELRVSPDIPTFEACLSEGAFDLAYMNPFHFTVFSDAPGYGAIAHRDGPGLRGIVVARKDKGIEGLEALAGQRIAFPSPAAFGASILIRGELRGLGIDIEPIYVNSHDSVYLAVNAGAMAAGGGVGRTYNAAPEFAAQNLEIMHRTEEYTPHAFAAHARVDQDAARAIQEALIELAAAQPDVLAPIKIKGWRAPDADAYEDVRALNVPMSDAGMDDLGTRTCRFG